MSGRENKRNYPPKRRKGEGSGPAPGRKGPTQLGFTGSGPRARPSSAGPKSGAKPQGQEAGAPCRGGRTEGGKMDPSPLAMHRAWLARGRGRRRTLPTHPLLLSPLLSSSEGPLTGTLGRRERHGVCAWFCLKGGGTGPDEGTRAASGAEQKSQRRGQPWNQGSPNLHTTAIRHPRASPGPARPPTTRERGPRFSRNGV